MEIFGAGGAAVSRREPWAFAPRQPNYLSLNCEYYCRHKQAPWGQSVFSTNTHANCMQLRFYIFYSCMSLLLFNDKIV